MSQNRIEKFQGYCPTQDKWEIVEQTYIDVTTIGAAHHEYIQGLLTCPYISFRNGNCVLSGDCPVVRGQWTSENPDVFVALQFDRPDGSPHKIVDDVIKPLCAEMGLRAFIVSEIEHMLI